MAAISAVFQSLVKPKDVLIVQGNIYGTTVDYVNELAKQMDLQVYFVGFQKNRRNRSHLFIA
jgi:cystathionine beta-lyase/cystathionine gamma-synthase